MVMMFQSERARNFLLENGVVFSFRTRKRRKLGKGWIADRRGGRRIADVLVEEEGEFEPLNLGLYVEYSGFNSLREWVEEIKKLNKGKLPSKGWLYRVSLII